MINRSLLKRDINEDENRISHLYPGVLFVLCFALSISRVAVSFDVEKLPRCVFSYPF